MSSEKEKFINQLGSFAAKLQDYVAMNGGDWSIKGFIDCEKNVYTISSDTKIISKS